MDIPFGFPVAIRSIVMVASSPSVSVCQRLASVIASVNVALEHVKIYIYIYTSVTNMGI